MKVSYAWLRAVAPELDLPIEELADALAARGAPVDEIVALGEGLDDVVVARVDSVEPHPDADRLRVCAVVTEEGSDPIQVVCGAPNVVTGRLYPFAPVGATLPGGRSVDEVELRGVRSRGMLCSERELGLGTDHEGLMELPDGLHLGRPLAFELGLRDWRLDVEVTANRGDLLSHVGVAREVAPGGQAELALPALPNAPEALDLELVADEREVEAAGVTVRVEAPDLCARYLGAVVRGVEVGPSPPWLQQRLRAAGSRPINNVVDATNYVLLELGQPLHAFDLDRLGGQTIVVRTPGDGEKSFTTLDGEERRLDPGMLLICDDERPVALAGVMGGLDSEVTAATTDVLLECAWFDPANTRRTRRALDLSTDASYRFERAVDPAGMERALRRTLRLIVATAGGVVEPHVADCNPRRIEARTLELRVARVEEVLGVPFEKGRIRELLEPLGFHVVKSGDEVMRVEVPGWRHFDVTREVDLIEEVARTHGFDAFPDELGPYRAGTVPDHPLFGLEDELRDLLVGRGFFESQTPAFVPASEGEVRVLNPVSREEDHVRSEVVPSLLRRVEHNWARAVRDVRLFELATSFGRAGPGEPPDEETRLALVMTGRSAPVDWSAEERPFDLWDLKGVLESVAARARPGGWLEPRAPAGKGLVEGRGFVVRDGGGAVVGWAGLVRDDRVDAPAWADPVFALELSLPAEPGEIPVAVHHPPTAFPGVDRDLALLVPDDLPARKVADAIRGSAGDHLAEVELFDRYVGEGVPDGFRSLAWRMRFRSRERTLTDADVDRATEQVVEHLRRELGVEPRGR